MLDTRTLPDDPAGRSGPRLRPYQEAALLRWTLAGRRGLVVLPTGAGKTHVGIAAMRHLNRPTLFLVPTRVLMEQWLVRLREAGVDEPGCYGDGRRELKPVTVSTFESGYRWMERLGDRFDLLVVDEVHHFGGGARDEALVMSVAPARLGLTATPPSDEAASRLRSLVGPTVYELAVSDLAGRFLAPFERRRIRVRLTPAERYRYDARMATFRAVSRAFFSGRSDATWPMFVAVASRTEEGRRALRALREARTLLCWPEGKRRAVATLLQRHRDERTLVFTTDNRTAYAIARAHLLMPITCDIGRKERDDVLARFRTGELRAIVSSRVLNEGVDVPDAQVGIVVGGAMGRREHVQRVGRLLRPAPMKRAIVYELVVEDSSEVRRSDQRNLGLAARPPVAV